MKPKRTIVQFFRRQEGIPIHALANDGTVWFYVREGDVKAYSQFDVKAGWNKSPELSTPLPQGDE